MITNNIGLTISYISVVLLNIAPFLNINVSPNFQVLFQTPLIVYIGSSHSIRLYSKSVDQKKEGIETMTAKDAMLFPVIAGCTLGGLYLAFQYFDKDLINILFHYYFSFIGTMVITSFFYNRFKESFIRSSQKIIFTIPKIRFITEEESHFDELYLLILICSVPVGFGYFITKHYFFNNVLGIFFSIFGIETILLGSTKIGFMLLSALFFYDIYFVFFTPLMVTVAKSLDGPIKLMFPKVLDWETQKDFNMIGLGDIVIPGIFVALMLRLDYYRILKPIINSTKEDPIGNKSVSFLPITNFNTFLWTFCGYFFGILSTLVVMNVFKAAQPALLYLVPGCLIFSVLSALIGGYYNFFINYEEDNSLKELGLVPEEKKEEKTN